MKKFVTYILIFISGAVVCQFALIFFFGSLDYKPEEKSVGVSDELVQGRFQDVCDVLTSSGCSCYPVVHTDRSCKGILNEFLLEKSKTPVTKKQLNGD